MFLGCNFFILVVSISQLPVVSDNFVFRIRLMLGDLRIVLRIFDISSDDMSYSDNAANLLRYLLCD